MPSRSCLARCAFLALAVSLAAPFAVAADPVAPLRIMSFNVRYSAAKDGDNAWPRRIEQFFATIARFAPDLIGFQEVLADQHDAITTRLPGYTFFTPITSSRAPARSTALRATGGFPPIITP